ncbi:MAG TPA: hypothetical protein VM692_11795 [Gammaproteobacteria bacterium]|nr:hypothetical protein [Gammaproteobacteria bacterium]
MIVEGLETYARVSGPWLQAWNAANAMNVSATRIAIGQVELAALTTRFMNDRLAAYASFDGHVEPLVRRLDRLTEQFADNYATQVRTIYSSWADVLRDDRPLTDAVGRAAERTDERFEGARPQDAAKREEATKQEGAKRESRREERPPQGRDTAAH